MFLFLRIWTRKRNLIAVHCIVEQEKRKKSNTLPNGLVEGDDEEEDGGHGGPELQRTGRWEFTRRNIVQCFCLK